MLKQPTLSVVFPNYNHARFLPEQLNSMLKQSYRPKEIIIIDDASTDNSIEVIEGFIRKEPRIQLICNERNMGVEWNINRLIEIASGDYIYLSASDDMVLPGFFEKSMTLLVQYPQAGLCSTVGCLIDEHGNDRGIRAIPVISNKPCFLSPKQVQMKLCRYGRWISTPTMIVRRDAVIQEGGQRLELGSFADTFLALIIALRHGACFIPEPLTCWRQMSTGHGSSMSRDWKKLLETGMLAGKLMRTTYSDLFPMDYVNRFERHWKYMVSRNVGNRACFEKKQALTQAMARQLYSMVKFAPWRWWILGRLSILVNLRKLVITEKLET